MIGRLMRWFTVRSGAWAMRRGVTTGQLEQAIDRARTIREINA